jgi:hydrogenase maturation protease
MKSAKRILIYGYGNIGRQDDALGVLTAENIEKFLSQNSMEGVEVESNFQLNIEDAETISAYDLVIFVDASLETTEDLWYVPVEPTNKVNFSMHAVSPGFIVKLCEELHSKAPQAYILHIKGFSYGFLGEMTKEAQKNLQKATHFLIQKIQEYCSASINS